MVEGSPFRNDPDFAFVYYNIRQKKAVLDSVQFRVSASQRDAVVSELLKVDVKTLDKLVNALDKDPRYKLQNDKETAILSLLQRVNTVSHDLPGSNGYKVMLRNQIRALINHKGTPTLFVTLNPADREHPLVEMYAGNEVDIVEKMRGEELSSWSRTVLAARNPLACARFFHKMISEFIRIVLRFGRPGKGLFGTCDAYYGTVEAQGRGTLHCHMLIWLRGHPSPQVLRDKMVSSETYRERMFRWLESTIKCQLPGDGAVVVERNGPLPKPRHIPGSSTSHPGSMSAPSIEAFEKIEDFEAAFNTYVTELVEVYNWHEHNSTCFKYVPGGRIPSNPADQDDLCRMRINGSTCGATHLDDESGAVLLRRLHPRIASYNDLVVFLMKCNMDIKFIGSGEAAKALLYYVTDYITKPSLPMHVGLSALSYAIQRTNEKFPPTSETIPTNRSRGALTIAVNRMISRQEMSHQQVMSYLVGGGDVYTSHTFRILHWGKFDRLFKQAFSDRSCEDDDVPENSVEPRTIRRGCNEDDGVDVDTGTDSMPLSEHMEIDDAEVDAIEYHNMDVERGGMDANAEDRRLDARDEEDADPMESDPEPNSCDGNAQEEDTFVLTLDKSGSISATNQQQDYIYRSTDPVFQSMSLYEFVGMTDKEKLGRDDQDKGEDAPGPRRGRKPEPRGRFSSDEHTQYTTHRLRRRTIWTVPVILGNRVPRVDRGVAEKEKWSRMMLILFVPWRQPHDLRRPGENWTSAFERQKSQLDNVHTDVISNMSVLSECRDARDAFREMRRAELLAQLRDGLPTSGARRHASNSDEDTRQEFQLFDSSHDTNAYECVKENDTTRHALDGDIGTRARELIDLCYGTDERGPRDLRAHEDAEVLHTGHQHTHLRPREAQDEPMILRHQTKMRELKRERRPVIESKFEEGRPRKKRRTAAVEERVTWESLPNTGAAHPTGSDINEPEQLNTLERVIRQVTEEMQLTDNPEQERAFRIVANHVYNGGDQLLMYIAGVGGTGKTHVVKAILRFFDLLARSKEILVSAPTGAAALNIGGYTIHSLLMMPSQKKGSWDELRKMWRGVRYLVIDEVSMIGAYFLSSVSKRLQQAKSNEGSVAHLPFGGVNIIFTGDFGQLKPVGASTLYDWKLVNNPDLQSIRSHTNASNLQGIYLWRQVQTVVKLTKNQRQLSDPEYAELLDRVRTGTAREKWDPKSSTKSDVDVLYGRIMEHVFRDSSVTMSDFADAPIIVGSKALRDALNARIIAHKAAEANEEVMIFHSTDKIGKEAVNAEMQRGLWKMSSSATDDYLGHLPMFIGMKVMIRDNLAFGKRLVNGAEGIVKKVIYDVVDGKAYARVAYVQVPGAGSVAPDLDEDIVPIFPEKHKFNCTVTSGGVKSVKHVYREQLPLVPSYAYTDYKSQGRSLTTAIVDLKSAKSLQGVYVMLSRLRSLQGLLLLRSVTPGKVCMRLSQELRDELSRIDVLDEITRLRFEKSR
ncbi:hypothetical protein ONZ51_g7564 [Trametes cubensis]|uniref:ATP-dependent DNA helicase n=1 Tax=Trametes cubensis TaxID=1111947 RepID=A0AAD7TQB9_9APHY|nr:hypothetical protein ONZ51_g7564 [Trametes cubensis]